MVTDNFRYLNEGGICQHTHTQTQKFEKPTSGREGEIALGQRRIIVSNTWITNSTISSCSGLFVFELYAIDMSSWSTDGIQWGERWSWRLLVKHH